MGFFQLYSCIFCWHCIAHFFFSHLQPTDLFLGGNTHINPPPTLTVILIVNCQQLIRDEGAREKDLVEFTSLYIEIQHEFNANVLHAPLCGLKYPHPHQGHILSSKHGFLPDLIIWQSMFWDIRRGWRNSWLREGYEIFTSSSQDSLTFSHPPSGLKIDLNLWPQNFSKIDFQTFSKSRPRETNS